MNTNNSYKPIDLKKLKTYPIKQRKNLVKVSDFAVPVSWDVNFSEFVESLPKILKGNDLRLLIDKVARANKNDKKVVFAMGAHVIKCGLSLIIIDLMERGIISGIALNGSGAIHDWEISFIGETSEDVADSLKDGSFGMAIETASALADASKIGTEKGIGLGRALGEKIIDEKNKFAHYSILAAGVRLNIPVTVHVAIGTDIVHMHPNVSGKNIGESTMIDFRVLSGLVSELNEGVWINIGSAVILPEVFLKAVSIARNLGNPLDKLTTANLDVIYHYRPKINVVERPSATGINITGHHEIMIPLLRLGILSKIKSEDTKRKRAYV